MRVSPDVDAMIAALTGAVQTALGGGLAGLYLRGSLVLGDFDPETSDIDFLAIVEEPLSEAGFERLRSMHDELATLPNRYSHHLEGAYIDRTSVRRFDRAERHHPELIAEHRLQWAELRDNWVLERWVVRERGITLAGSDPATLIDPIGVDDLRAAVQGELDRRVEHWAAPGAEVPGWLRLRFMQAFEVETVCRALYTIRSGELCSKPAAVRWALGVVPEPWRTLIRDTQLVRADHTEDESDVDRVKAFARWAASDRARWAAET